MKRFISLFFALILTFAAVSCSGGEIPEETTETVAETLLETEPEPTMVGLIGEGGEALYRIIRPDDATDSEIQIAIELKKALKELTGADFSITTDFLMPNEDVTVINEILIGSTNRTESIAASEGVTVNDYVIRVDGNKIVIAGGGEGMLLRAVEEFLSIVGAGNTFMIDKNTDIRRSVERGPYIVALTNQGKSQLEVYDISDGKLDESSLVWACKMPYYNVAGTKFRHSETHGDVALAVCGNSYGCMVSYPEGKVLWSTEAAASNPHSIELMPNGVIAIASSSGGEVRFFTTDKKTSRNPSAKVVLEDAHGVLWDDEKQVLWAIGRTVLTAYRVTLDGSKVTVTEEESLRATIPSDWSHDLAPVYGNKNELWITTGSHVYRFNKTTKTFTADPTLDRANIKGVGNFDDGSMVYIYPDGAFKSWTSQSAFLIKADTSSAKTATSADGHFYKIRVWDTRYQ
jgi:hypothetical protein